MNIILKNATIITHTGEVLLNQDIAVSGQLIEKVGKDIHINDYDILDCSGKFITPTFAAMHTHTPMNIFKGIAEDVNIDDWFNKELWPYESKMQDQDIYNGARLAICEMLQNGISAFADHYFKGELIAKASEELGIKADIAYTIFGFGGDCNKELADACTFFEAYQNHPNIKPRLGPHSPYICSKEVLKTVIDKAKELGCGIHIHVSETQQQVQESKQAHNGETPFEVLAQAGAFQVPCIIGHGLWIEKTDLPLINENCCFAVSPKTYMKLGMYKGDLWKYAKQLPIVSGNDGSASSNSIDVLEQMRMFALLGKWQDQAEEFTLKEIWGYLMNAHNFLDFNSGKIQSGMSADLNIWDLSTPSTAPVYNPLATIIYSAIPAIHITDTLINGKFVKKDGMLCAPVAQIVESASKCAKQIYQRGKGVSSLYF